MTKKLAKNFLFLKYGVPINDEVLISHTNGDKNIITDYSFKDLLKIAYDLQDVEQPEQHIFDVFNDAIKSHIREYSKDPVALIISSDLMYDYRSALTAFPVNSFTPNEPDCMKYEGINVISLRDSINKE